MLAAREPSKNVSKECVKFKLSSVPGNERVSLRRPIEKHFPNCLLNKTLIPVILLLKKRTTTNVLCVTFLMVTND